MNCRIGEVPTCRIAVPQRPLDLVRRAASLVRMMLGEIFDENAYARFLERTGVASSRSSYAAFLRESQRARERRPRCC